MPTDILIGDNADTLIVNGDVVLGESNLQHQRILLAIAPGELKQFPVVGVGVAGFLKDEDSIGLQAKIKEQFQKDGMTVKSLSFNNTELDIDAYYKEATDAD